MSLFDTFTEEYLLNRALENAPEGIDTREGSVFYDAVAGSIKVLAELFVNAEIMSEQKSVITATGEFLDILANELYLGHLSREQAVKALYEVKFTTFEGVGVDVLDIEDGDLYQVGDLYFYLRFETNEDEGTIKYYLEAENDGVEYNGFESTEENPVNARPVESVEYLSSATVQQLIREGVDLEDDDKFRARIRELLAAPSENANVSQYKTWCENIEGVGSATIIPLFAGPNTIEAILVDNEYKPCSQDVVDKVQNIIDPITQNTKIVIDGQEIIIGDGLGDGKAPLGAHFYATAAKSFIVELTVSDLEVKNGYDETTVKANIKRSIESYLSLLVKESKINNPITIVQSKIISYIYNANGVDTINSVYLGSSTTGNLIIPVGQIPIIEEVNFE